MPSFSKLIFEVVRPKRMTSLRQLEKTQWLGPEQIAEVQFRKLQALLAHVHLHCPYYRGVFEERGFVPEDIRSLADFARLPLLNKTKIRESASQILARNAGRRDALENSTSGSTGVTLDFFSDRNAADLTNALGLRANRWTGWEIGERQVTLWGASHDDRTARFYGKIKNKILHRKMFLSSYGMSKRNMIDYRYKINRFKPRLIEGYASALSLFAKFVQDYQLRMHQPLGVISTAETLSPPQKKLIESVFHCRVFNRYGSREVSGIAQECERQNGLHVFAEHVLVEVLDENDHPCPPGKIGKIVVTDLDNFTFPFLRYDIGDLAVATDRVCGCGRGLPLLGQVEGRVWDVIIGANGNRLVGTFWLVSGVKGIKQFQVLQEKAGELIIKVVPEAAFTEEEKRRLLKNAATNCGVEMSVEVRLVDEIPQTESGKHRYVISRISPFL
jgi:phenylacetate-CoA ligase